MRKNYRFQRAARRMRPLIAVLPIGSIGAAGYGLPKKQERKASTTFLMSPCKVFGLSDLQHYATLPMKQS